MHKLLSFEESLSHIHIDLAIPGHPSFSIAKLKELADLECSKLLKPEVKIQDYLGNTILRHQIKKSLFCKEAEDHFIIRSNISEIIKLISPIQELKLAEKAITQEEIISYLKSHDEQEFCYYIDNIGLDLTNLNLKKIILISSVELRYGTKGLNLAWAYIPYSNLYTKISDELSYIGPSASHLSEVYAIIAIRNDLLIKSINQNIISKNFESISSFLKKYSYLFEHKIFPLHNYCILEFKDKSLEKKLLNNSIILLRKNANGIFIHYGQENFISSLAALKNIIEEQ